MWNSNKFNKWIDTSERNIQINKISIVTEKEIYIQR